MNNIKFIKLLSGEELISEIINEDEDIVELKNPVALMVHPQEGGLMMIPWIPYSDDKEYIIKRTCIILMSSVRDYFLNPYKEKFNGIVTATSQQTQILTP